MILREELGRHRQEKSAAGKIIPLTQGKLAAELGLSQNIMHEIEKGQRKLGLSEALNVAQIVENELGCDPWVFLNEPNPARCLVKLDGTVIKTDILAYEDINLVAIAVAKDWFERLDETPPIGLTGGILMGLQMTAKKELRNHPNWGLTEMKTYMEDQVDLVVNMARAQAG